MACDTECAQAVENGCVEACASSDLGACVQGIGIAGESINEGSLGYAG